MIDERILMFIVILVLTFIFEHKIFPQLGLWVLVLFGIYLQITNSAIVQIDVYYIFLFVINLVYITYMILTDEQTDPKTR